MGGGPRPARAQDTGALEYKVKAGYVFNFAKFIEWPEASFATPQAPMIVAVLDDNSVVPTFQQVLQGKAVNGRPIEVKTVASVGAAAGAHVLVVPRSFKLEAPAIRQQLGRSATLIVGEVENFAESGGTIGFVKDGENLRFHLNLEVADAVGLKVSSKLSSVARIVHTRDKK